MVQCAIYGCSNNWGKENLKNEKYSFYRFPRDSNMCIKWINACGRKDKINTNVARICSKHFLESDYRRNLKYELMNYSPPSARSLKDDAVPTQALPFSKNSTVDPGN